MIKSIVFLSWPLFINVRIFSHLFQVGANKYEKWLQVEKNWKETINIEILGLTLPPWLQLTVTNSWVQIANLEWKAYEGLPSICIIRLTILSLVQCLTFMGELFEDLGLRPRVPSFYSFFSVFFPISFSLRSSPYKFPQRG